MDWKTLEERHKNLEKEFSNAKKLFLHSVSKFSFDDPNFKNGQSSIDSIISSIHLESLDNNVISQINQSIADINKKITDYKNKKLANLNASTIKKSVKDKTAKKYIKDKSDVDFEKTINHKKSKLNVDFNSYQNYLAKVNKYIATLSRYNKTFEDLQKKSNLAESASNVGFKFAESALGTQGAATAALGFSFARKMMSKEGRKELGDKWKTETGSRKRVAANVATSLGILTGSPGMMLIGSGLKNQTNTAKAIKDKKEADVSNFKKIQSKFNIITADKGGEGYVTKPTALMMAADGKPESFNVTPGKTSLNGVEVKSKMGGEKGLDGTNQIIAVIKESNNILKKILSVGEDQFEFNVDQARDSDLARKKSAGGLGGLFGSGEDPNAKPDTILKKEKEKSKSIFSFAGDILTHAIGEKLGRMRLIPSGKTVGRVGGTLAGAGLGYGAGNLLAAGLGLEEGGTAETALKWGGAATGAIGGFKIGGKLGKAGKFLGKATSAVSKATAQPVYVVNADEIGKGGIGDLIPGKVGKIFKGGFGRSATRLAAKIGGRGAAKTVAGLTTKIGGSTLAKGLGSKIPIVGGLIAGGITLAAGGGKGAAIGSGAGTIAGGALGSLAGPVGTVVGSVVGGFLGEKLGELFAKQNKNEVELQKTKAENDKTFYEKLVGPGSFIDSVKNAGGAIWDSAKKFGHVAFTTGAAAVKTTGAVIGKGYEKVKEVAGGAWAKTKSGLENLGAKGSSYLSQNIGRDYAMGAKGKSGAIDCSGLSRQIVKDATGQDVGHGSANQMDKFVKNGKFIKGTDFSSAKPGDLIFYNRGSSRNGVGRPDHVAVYLGMGKDGQPRMIHTGSNKEKSTIKVATTKGLIGFGRPNDGAAVAKMLLGDQGKTTLGSNVADSPSKPEVKNVSSPKAKPEAKPAGNAKTKVKLDQYSEPIIFGDAQERRQNKQRAELKAKKKREQEANMEGLARGQETASEERKMKKEKYNSESNSNQQINNTYNQINNSSSQGGQTKKPNVNVTTGDKNSSVSVINSRYH